MAFSLLADALLDKLIGPWARIGERKLDLTGGSLVLRNVALRDDALDALGLPVAIRGGEVGELELTVPWTKLSTEPVIVKLSRVCLLLAPVSEDEWDEAVEARRAVARKARRLDQLRSMGPDVDRPAEGGGGFVERMVDRVLDLAQVFVVSAVVRYEDYTHSHAPFALEVAMDSLWLHPAESAESAPAKSSSRSPFRHREALVCALCAYVLTDADLPPKPQKTPCANGGELLARLRSGGVEPDAPAAMRVNSRECILEPLSFAIEACSKANGATFPPSATALPQHTACLETGRLLLRLHIAEFAHLSGGRPPLLALLALPPP